MITIDETEPSESDPENDTVTICPVFAGFGETLLTDIVGGRSLMVNDPLDDPVDPLLSIAVTTIENVRDVAFPVFAKT